MAEELVQYYLGNPGYYDESEQQETEVEEVAGANQRRRAHRDHRGRVLQQNSGRVR